MEIGDQVFRKIDPMRQAKIVVGVRRTQNQTLYMAMDIHDELTCHLPLELEIIHGGKAEIREMVPCYGIGDRVYISETMGFITAIDQVGSMITYDVSIKGTPISYFDFEISDTPAYES